MGKQRPQKFSKHDKVRDESGHEFTVKRAVFLGRHPWYRGSWFYFTEKKGEWVNEDRLEKFE